MIDRIEIALLTFIVFGLLCFGIAMIVLPLAGLAPLFILPFGIVVTAAEVFLCRYLWAQR